VCDASERQRVTQIERDLLRHLCQRGGIRAIQTDQRRALGHYRWIGQDHRIIFEALVSLASAPANSLREQLPGEATRMGFPDIQWEAYLEEPDKADDTVAELIAQLIPGSAN